MSFWLGRRRRCRRPGLRRRRRGPRVTATAAAVAAAVVAWAAAPWAGPASTLVIQGIICIPSKSPGSEKPEPFPLGRA